jgi:hypothetical protein
MTVRRVYRWEAPLETTKYLAIYLTLWYFNLILPGAVSDDLPFSRARLTCISCHSSYT